MKIMNSPEIGNNVKKDVCQSGPTENRIATEDKLS